LITFGFSPDKERRPVNVLKKLMGFFTATPAGSGVDKSALPLAVKCARCGEIVRTRVNLYSELSAEYAGDATTNFIWHKALIGSRRCYQPIEVTLKFNAQRQVIERQIAGGTFVE
jgi:hypothetical protein